MTTTIFDPMQHVTIGDALLVLTPPNIDDDFDIVLEIQLDSLEIHLQSFDYCRYWSE